MIIELNVTENLPNVKRYLHSIFIYFSYVYDVRTVLADISFSQLKLLKITYKYLCIIVNVMYLYYHEIICKIYGV